MKISTVMSSVGAGGTQRITLSNGGTGNFGGANLAKDNQTCAGATDTNRICVDTGNAQFEFKKANFNGVDVVNVGGTAVVATTTSQTRGLVLLGPLATAAFPGNVTCSLDGNDHTSTWTWTDTAATVSSSFSVQLSSQVKLNSQWIDKPVTVGGVSTTVSHGNGGTNDVTNTFQTTGPAAPSGTQTVVVTLGPSTACTRIYSSANDANSVTTIEENGPAMAVIKSVGYLAASTGQVYMPYTTRITIYKYGTSFSATNTLRNANYDTSGTSSPDCNQHAGVCWGYTFNTATKGYHGWSFRIQPNITGTINYQLAGETTLTGTVTGTDDLSMYQARTSTQQTMQVADSCGGSFCYQNFDIIQGYTIKKNATVLASDTTGTKLLGGWVDIANPSGVGITAGHYQMTAAWPETIRVASGGTELQLDMDPVDKSLPGHLMWLSWRTNDLWFKFHATAPATPTADFLKYQHRLVGRPADVFYINSTNYLPYPMMTAAEEDQYYVGLATSSSPPIQQANFCGGGSGISTNCTPDRGVSDGRFPLGWFKFRDLSQGGAFDQEDYAWSDAFYRFWQRGQTGRFLNTFHYYRWAGDDYVVHTDGQSSADGQTVKDSRMNSFLFSSRPGWWSYNETPSKIPEQRSDGGFPMNICYGMGSAGPNCYGFPSGSSTVAVVNGNDAIKTNTDPLHDWVVMGMARFYEMTGDEWFKDAVIARKAYYLSNQTRQACAYGTVSTAQSYWFPGFSGLCFNGSARTFGIELYNASVFYEWLASLGDPDANNVLFQGSLMYDYMINTQGCLNGFPSGCTPASLAQTTPGTPEDLVGMSFERGIFQSSRGDVGNKPGGGFCAYGDGGISSGLTGSYRITQPFQNSIVAEAILAYRHAKGPTWNGYNRALDYTLGLSVSLLKEQFIDDGSAQWQLSPGPPTTYPSNGMMYLAVTDLRVECPASTTVPAGGHIIVVNGHKYDDYTVANADQGASMGFYANYLSTGQTSTWRRQFEINMDQVAFHQSWPADFGGYNMGAPIYSILHPSGRTLQEIPFTVTDLGSGNYRLTFTPPASTCTNDPQCLRIKWSGRQIQKDRTKLLDYQSPGCDPQTTNCFTYNPTTYIPWFSSANAELTGTVPTPTPGVAMNVTVVTSTTGLNTTANSPNFSVSTMAISGCSISPSTVPPFTAGQVVSFTFTQSGCNTGMTWGATGLNGSGLNIGTGNGTLTGTAVAGNYAATITYDTAQLSVTVVVNGPPSVTTNSMPPGTVGQSYSNGLAISGGTSPITCSAGTGLSGSGLSVTSACTVSGTVTGTANTYTASGVTPTDANGISGTAKSFTIVINAAPSITTTCPLPTGTQGTAYSTTLTSTGGTAPLAWSITSGALIAGLSLNASTGVISGTPTGSGTATLTLHLVDTNAVAATDKTGCALTINSTGPPSVPNYVGVFPGGTIK
jgi:hypothetical protein